VIGLPAAAGRCDRRLRFWVSVGVLLALVGHAGVLWLWPDAHTLLIDLQVYRAGAEHLLAGRPLYVGGVLLDLPFVYPPFAAAAFVPLLALPLPALKLLWTAGALALLGFVTHRGLRSLGVPLRPPLGWGTVGLVALATWLDPVRTTLYLGQINVVVLALVLGDLLGRCDRRWCGVGVGLAAALKLTPLLFVGYLLVTGRWRAAGTASLTFALAGAMGVLLAPGDSRTYWWDGTFAAAGRISDIAATTNHSLNGLLSRSLGEGVAARIAFFVGAAVLVIVTMVLARRAHRRGEELLALTLCGLCSAAAAPFAWSHHWVWFVPLIIVLGHRVVGPAQDRVAGGLLAVVLTGTVAVITALPGPGIGPIPRTGLISLWPDTYLALYMIVLVVVAARGGPVRGRGRRAYSALPPVVSSEVFGST
jgi:alpha-1,2-mannosyltransferase